MSDDNKNSDPFDFDFNDFNEGTPPATAEDSFGESSHIGDNAAVPDEDARADNPPEAAPKTIKNPKVKKEKVPKEKKPAREAAPSEFGTVLCVAFSLLLLASLIGVNIAAFLRGDPNKMVETIFFLCAFNVVGLALLAVPVMFYRFPKERTLPNVLLGISVVALFSAVEVFVWEFYLYNFNIIP